MKECCANCKHLERLNPDYIDVGGYCLWDGTPTDGDPEEVTCFDFEEKTQEMIEFEKTYHILMSTK